MWLESVAILLFKVKSKYDPENHQPSFLHRVEWLLLVYSEVAGLVDDGLVLTWQCLIFQKRIVWCCCMSFCWVNLKILVSVMCC